MKQLRIISLICALCLFLSACASQQPEDGSSTEPPNTVRITIPEGASAADIGDLMEQNGLFTRSEFLAEVNRGNADSPLVQEIGDWENRAFLLEGYLFPDTYEFYRDDSPERVIQKLLDNLEKKITGTQKARAKEFDMTMDEVLTLASIIQAEAGDPAQMKTVSSVLHNRLNSKSHPKLECDVTIFYLEQEVQPYLTEDKDRFNSFYNTYKCTGLPEGPICNPGMDAINAALNPEQTDYFYFATDKAGKYYYAKTLAEHQKNWNAIKKVNAALTTAAQANTNADD